MHLRTARAPAETLYDLPDQTWWCSWTTATTMCMDRHEKRQYQYRI